MMGEKVLAAGAVSALVLALAALGAATASASPTPAARAFVPGELLVRFKPRVGETLRAHVLREEGVARNDRLALAGTAVVRLAAGQSVDAAAEAFEQHPEVLYAEPNWIYRAAVIPNDLRFGELWGLDRIGAPAAWDLNTGSAAVKVAVVDTGVAYDHPDLAPNVVAGWDFVGNDNDASDQHGHGTHVAGTIGARGNDGLGVAGVNWNVALMPVQVLSPVGNGRIDQISEGLAFAARNGAKVVNASLGGSNFSQTMERAIREAPETLFVVAAGNGARDNDTSPIYPCNYDLANVVCVAASDRDDSKASFSNFGATSVDLAAPGVNVVSTALDGSYLSLSGTSMAAPHVAGVAALIWARAPWATVADVRSALLSTVDRIPALAGTSVTGGRLNAARALGAAPPTQPAPPPPQPQPMPQPVRRLTGQVRCVVPRVTGRTFAEARRMLAARHCAVGRTTRAFSSRRRGRVIRQSRRPRTALPAGARVNLVVSRGRRR
jgi:subtilisin family serine protease